MAEKAVSPEMVLAHNDGLRREIKRLRRDLDRAERERLTDEQIRRMVLEMCDAEVETPRWAKQKLKLATDELVPVLCLSDVHYGEVVDPAAINYVNNYNTRIACERIQRWVDKAILLCRSYVKATYPGIVVPVCGDLFSGSIHEELDATNEVTMPQALLDLMGIFKGAFTKLANEFGKVRVVSVSGNHGRLDMKPRFKQAARRNFDWLLMCIVERMFSGDKRFSWNVATAADAQFTVCGTTFNVSHGDDMKGGGGIRGAVLPWVLGDYRKRQTAQATDRPFDHRIFGHWHQQAQIFGIIANGSVKGYDEYAAGRNLPFESPQQQLFLVRRDGRIAYWLPVFLD